MLDSKKPLSIADQISLLESRGLVIDDLAEAKHFLRNVSYYRLAGYWWSLQTDRRKHTFVAGTKITHIISRYNFDRELRLIVTNMIERIEVSIRTRLVYELTLAYGSHWFEEPKYFHQPKNHQGIIDKIQDEVRRSKEIFMQEHKKKYTKDTRCPPAWKSFEVLSMGTLSRIYASLNNELPEKNDLARNLGLGYHKILTNWLQTITVVRNICAHHSRLYDRDLPIWPTKAA